MKTSTPLPDKIGRYQILERVGRGGMGVLYRGHDPVLDREVAVKVMLADFSDDTEQMRPRFYREAKSAAKLQHRNIVTIFEFAEENNQPHIVMEFLRGAPLNARMEEHPPLTLDDKLDIVAQLCSGLGYAHSQGIVHRDVKPANVFILQDGTVKLLDFGIARLATSTLTAQGDVVGSAPYMSPEQIAGAQDLDGRSDVWSTGVLLYELLTGRKPFAGEGLTTVIAGILREQPTAVEKLVPGLPKALLDTVTRALEKDRDRRFQSAEELGRELQLIRRTHQLSAPPPMDETRLASTNVLKALHDDRQKQDGSPGNKTLHHPPPVAAVEAMGRSGSKTWLIAAGAVIAIAAIGGGYLMMRPSSPSASSTQAPPTSAPPPLVQPVLSTTPAPSTPPSTPAPSTPPSTPPGTAANAAATPPIESRPAVGSRAAGTEKVPPPAKKSTPVPSAAAAVVPAASATVVPAAPRAANVAVTMSAAYPFEVWDGARVISPASTSHELPPQPNGRTLRVVAADVFLDQPVKVDDDGEQRFEYSPPGLGRIAIRAVRGDCKATIGKADLGYGPWPKPIQVAAGDYQVNLVCPDGQNPVMKTTVTQGLQTNVFFKQ